MTKDEIQSIVDAVMHAKYSSPLDDYGVTFPAAAKALGYHRDTILRLVAAGKLRVVGKGRLKRILVSEIEAYRRREAVQPS